jgi:hypothetical protein
MYSLRMSWCLLGFLFNRNDESSTFLRNVGDLPDHTASLSTGWYSSHTSMLSMGFEPQILVSVCPPTERAFHIEQQFYTRSNRLVAHVPELHGHCTFTGFVSAQWSVTQSILKHWLKISCPKIITKSSFSSNKRASKPFSPLIFRHTVEVEDWVILYRCLPRVCSCSMRLRHHDVAGLVIFCSYMGPGSERMQILYKPIISK